MPKLNSISSIPAQEDSDYIVLAYVPGPGNTLYAGRDEEWTRRNFRGCTGELKAHIESIPTCSSQNIAVRVISTMTPENEAAVKEKRDFQTPSNSPQFSVITDPNGEYEKFCDDSCKRTAIDSGELLYQPHTMIFKKIRFDAETHAWTGLCIAVLKRGDGQNIFGAIAAHNEKCAVASLDDQYKDIKRNGGNKI